MNPVIVLFTFSDRSTMMVFIDHAAVDNEAVAVASLRLTRLDESRVQGVFVIPVAEMRRVEDWVPHGAVA